jgi:hypothetical protein
MLASRRSRQAAPSRQVRTTGKAAVSMFVSFDGGTELVQALVAPSLTAICGWVPA